MTVDDYADRKRLPNKSPTRVSVWFTHNQKYENWDGNRLNTLHIWIIILFAIMYISHIVCNPFLNLVQSNDGAIIASTIIEAACLITATGCLIKMLHVNGSPSAAKVMFRLKSNIRMYM